MLYDVLNVNVGNVYSESILEVVAFHEKVAASGFQPDQTMPQMMCEEFYGCNTDLEQVKKSAKKKKSIKKAASKSSSQEL